MEIAKLLVLFAVVSALFSGMWYTKNYALNKNPFGPFAEGIFDGRNWTTENTQAYLNSVSWQENSFGHFVLAPFKLVLMPNQYGEIGFLGPLFLMLIPLLILILIIQQIYKQLKETCISETANNVTILLYCVVSYIAWFLATHQSRLLIPILALLSLLAAQTICYGVFKTVKKFIVITVLVSMFLNAAFAVGYHGKGIAVVTGLESKEAYLERIIPAYPALEYGRNLSKDSFTVFFGEVHAYYFDRAYLFESAPLQGVLDYNKNAAQIYKEMKTQKVTNLLINKNVIFNDKETCSYCAKIKETISQEPFASHMNPVFEKNNVVVYELV